MTEVTATTGNPFYLNRVGEVTNSEASNGMLAQEDFLTLLTTQLQNQDPLSPMDNAEFLGQMAQFSTVEGIEDVNAGIAALTEAVSNNQVQTAAGFLGRSVLASGNIARPGNDGAVRGMAELQAAVSDVTVTYTDPTTGNILHTQELGAHSDGWMSFDWEDVPTQIADSRSPVMVTVTGTSATGTISAPVSVFARVESALGGPATPNITLLVEDYGALDSLEVSAFR